MSSKRRQRRKSCQGKRRHASAADAGDAIDSMVRAGKARVGALSPYACRFCGGWHVGHSGRWESRPPRRMAR
jgi:hypothetical protein